MPDNQHNDPLERFFRKKAGEYNIRYHEEDWNKLENRLDNLDQKYANRRRRYLVAAVVIFLFSLLAYITYEQQLKINQLNERLTNAEDITNPNPVWGMLPDEVAPIDEESPPASLKNEPRSNSKTSAIASNDQTENEQTKSLATKVSEENAAAKESYEGEESISDIIVETSLAATPAKVSPGFDGRSPAISAIKPTEFNAQTTIPENPHKNTSVYPISRKSITSQAAGSRFSVGILAGPDMSTVSGVSNFYDPGYKLGLALEYQLSQNIAISVGAIHSKVRYSASGSEYQPPQGYWSYGAIPDETIGECILIDIPISLKYDFWHFQHSRLYATAGLSSYIMLDEDYRFNYENNYPGQRQRWHERTGTRHWMSNATLSVGYELDLMHSWSIRAEPFLKIPLQEVGWGNVKLYSLGSFVSINYHIH